MKQFIIILLSLFASLYAFKFSSVRRKKMNGNYNNDDKHIRTSDEGMTKIIDSMALNEKSNPRHDDGMETFQNSYWRDFDLIADDIRDNDDWHHRTTGTRRKTFRCFSHCHNNFDCLSRFCSKCLQSLHICVHGRQ